MTMTRRLASWLLVVLMCTTGAISARAGEKPEHTANVREVGGGRLDWTKPKADAGPVYIRDLAFSGRLVIGAVQGGHGKVSTANDVGESGIAIFRLARTGNSVTQVGVLRCHATGYVSVVGRLVFQGALETTAMGATGEATDPCDQEGLRIIDISDPADPRVASFVEIPCGVQPLAVMRVGERLYVYAPSTCQEDTDNPYSLAPVAEMTVIRVDPRRPQVSRVVRSDSMLPMTTCEQFTIHSKRHLAACYGDGRIALFDLADPAYPRYIDGSMIPVTPSPGGQTRLAMSWDGSVLAAGNGTAQPQRTGAVTSVRFFDIEDPGNPVPVGEWTAPPGIGSDAPVLTLSFIPTKDGRRLLTVAHGHRGMYVIDVAEPSDARAVAYFNGMDTSIEHEGELPAKALAAHWYNGRIVLADRGGRIRLLEVDELHERSVHYFRDSYNPLTVTPAFVGAR